MKYLLFQQQLQLNLSNKTIHEITTYPLKRPFKKKYLDKYRINTTLKPYSYINNTITFFSFLIPFRDIYLSFHSNLLN